MREVAGAVGGGITGAVMGLSIDTLLSLETPNFDGKIFLYYAIAVLTTAGIGALGKYGGKLADINAQYRERIRQRQNNNWRRNRI